MTTMRYNSNLRASGSSLAGHHLLLVEDCFDQGRLYLKMLQDAGAQVTLECNGWSAVDAVNKSPTLYDGVLMDFRMPELDGLEATRKLRELGYTNTIIALTAYGSEDLKQAWFQAGCNEYLEKPVEKQGFIETLRKWMHLPVQL